MGEYAKRKTDQEEIKIGTCDCMYYLRYEDRHTVEALPGHVDTVNTLNLFWRLPLPSEDEILPGCYKSHQCVIRLYYVPEKRTYSCQYAVDFRDETMAENPGTMQLHHESGLLLNVPCYHGLRLPDVQPPMQAFWNGKTHSIELAHIRNIGQNDIVPIIRCRHCGNTWTAKWKEVLDYIPDKELRERLAVYDRT